MAKTGLTPAQKECIKLMIGGDLKLKDIAAQIGVTQNTISNWRRNDLFVETYERAVRDGLANTAAKALRTMVGLLDSPIDNVRYSAAKDLLDRCGYRGEENDGNKFNQIIIVGGDQVAD